MTKNSKIRKNKKHNLKLYYIYKAFSWDLLFYYAISFLFLTEYKGLTPAEVIFADSFYPIFKIVFQVPCTLLVEKFEKRTSIIIGNIFLAISLLFVLSCNYMYLLIICNLFMAFAFVLKNLCESNILYDSLPKSKNKQKIFSKIDGISSSIYFLFEAISCVVAGFSYTINPNFPIYISLSCVIISIILSHMFKEVPIDTSNEEETYSEKTTTIERLKEYIRNLKNAFKFIFSSPRLRSLIYFNAIFVAIIFLLTSYRRSLLIELGISAEYLGIIFAALGIISSIISALTPKIHKLFRNKALTYLGLYYTFSVTLAGLSSILALPFILKISIILLMFAIQFSVKGPFYTLIRQYLSSFSSSKMRIKIVAASTLIEGFITSIISFIGAFLLDITSTSVSFLIVGIFSILLVVILLEYMKTRVGLKPEEYGKKDIEFIEVE